MAELTILDGAMGAMLRAAGLRPGERPEIFGMEHPEIVEKIHRAYVEAGSRVIHANTSGANAHRLADTGCDVEKVISVNVAAAKRAAAGRAKVALAVGPVGERLEPRGTLPFDAAYEVYAQMVRAGEQAGADLVAFESMSDLADVRAAVLAAREQSDLPVWVTMDFDASGRTAVGTTVGCMACTLDGFGVSAMGISGLLGPEEIYPLIEEMRSWTDKPIIVRPSAGLLDPAAGEYHMDASEFARQMDRFRALGVSILGGGCGTTPEFIRRLAQLSPGEEDLRPPKRQGVCSVSHMTEFAGVRIIGERINPTGKERLQRTLLERNFEVVKAYAMEQAAAGADILDININALGVNEAELMPQVVRAIQSVVDLPLQLDSVDSKAIEAGLRACNGRAIVNSVTAAPESLHSILPLVKKYGAAVVGLTMNEEGVPETAQQRLELARRIAQTALSYGIPKREVYIDCLALPVISRQDQAQETLKAVRMVHEQMGLHCVLGVSNISYGMARRGPVTASFLTQAMLCGLDLPIINPNQTAVMDAVAAYRALSGEDKNCEAYFARFPEKE